MKIPVIPSEYSTTLPEHDGQADAPLFVYEPYNEDEAAEVGARLHVLASTHETDLAGENRVSEDAAVKFTRFFVDAFNQRIRRIENLVVGDAEEPFEAARPDHLRSVPAKWKVAVGREILTRLQRGITEREEGN
ncbi:MAG: hypothetical protein ACREMA_02230 [Longimicrobiales bacterium]